MNALISRVPIPNLPPEPADYSMPAGLVVVLSVAIVAVVVFGWAVISADFRAPTRPPSWRVILPSAALTLLCSIGGALGMLAGQREVEAAEQEYGEAERAAGEQVRGDLEAAYGMQWQRYSYIPMQDGEWGGVELRLPDGTTQDCFVVAEDGYYSIRCGGDTPEESEPLEPVSP